MIVACNYVWLIKRGVITYTADTAEAYKSQRFFGDKTFGWRAQASRSIWFSYAHHPISSPWKQYS